MIAYVGMGVVFWSAMNWIWTSDFGVSGRWGCTTAALTVAVWLTVLIEM